MANGDKIDILVDTGASKGFMSMSFYQTISCLHALPSFTSRVTSIPVGNGQHCSIPFIILVIEVDHGLQFEIITMVSEIYGNVNLALGIKNRFMGSVQNWPNIAVCVNVVSENILALTRIWHTITYRCK